MPERALGEIETRLAQLQMLVAIIVILTVILFGFALAVGGYFIVHNQHQSNKALACYIIPQIDRAQQTLPTLQYYKDNPKELAQQMSLLQDQRDRAIATWGTCPDPEVKADGKRTLQGTPRK